MDQKQTKSISSAHTRFAPTVRASEIRTLSAVPIQNSGLRTSFEMSSIIGWSLGVPTLIAAVIGRGLEIVFPTAYPWTLLMLGLGFAVGCVYAWQGVAREERLMREEQGDYEG